MTSPLPLSRARLTELIANADPWRGLPADPTLRRESKEWQHFLVFGESWALLFNLSTDGRGGGRTTTVLSRTDWRGHVAPCRAPDVRPGRMDASFDRAGMRFRSGRYEVWNHGEGTRFEAVLAPAAVPSLSHHIPLGRSSGFGAHVSWCLVPRLMASGWVEIDDMHVPFEGRLAYHDHNWGRFGWGGDFSWEWGCAVPADPEDPWTVVYARMNDRARTRTTATSVFLVRAGQHYRYFRNAEVAITTEGALDGRPSGRVPPAAALLLPDRDRDVPRWTRFEAAREGDRLSGEIEACVRGQLLMPSDSDVRRIVRINEAHTRAQVRGRCGGEDVNLDGPGVLEVVCG